jgi:hypothetical protein
LLGLAGEAWQPAAKAVAVQITAAMTAPRVDAATHTRPPHLPVQAPRARGATCPRHERQRQARAEAFSRRTAIMAPAAPPPVSLAADELALIDRLVRHDRAAVSSALLAIAGIGAREPRRRKVLAGRRADVVSASGGDDQRQAGRADRRSPRALDRARDRLAP